jgi:hypothetical protein
VMLKSPSNASPRGDASADRFPPAFVQCKNAD